jgi:hypothetical protein
MCTVEYIHNVTLYQSYCWTQNNINLLWDLIMHLVFLKTCDFIMYTALKYCYVNLCTLFMNKLLQAQNSIIKLYYDSPLYNRWFEILHLGCFYYTSFVVVNDNVISLSSSTLYIVYMVVFNCFMDVFFWYK